MKLLNILTIAAISATAFTACKKDSDKNTNSSSSNATTFKVRMTDAPGSFMAMNTQITSVDAMVDGEWVNLSNQSQNVSVLTLTNGNEMVVANDGSAETGVYTKLRFTFGTNNTINVMENGQNNQYNLSFGSGVSNTVEMDINKQVNSGDKASVLVDFNVANSVSSSILGNWMFDPNMMWIQDESTGVKGQITGASRSMIELTADNGEKFSTWADNQGRFLLRGMTSGSYDVEIMGMASGSNSESNMNAGTAVVTSGSITNMGTIAFE